jgi:hypothetical protein
LAQLNEISTLGKKLWIKFGAIGNILGKHIKEGKCWENLWETDRGHGGNTKIPKNWPLPLRPLLYPKGKDMDPPGCMLNHLIGCMKMLFLKLFVTIFDLG